MAAEGASADIVVEVLDIDEGTTSPEVVKGDHAKVNEMGGGLASLLSSWASAVGAAAKDAVERVPATLKNKNAADEARNDDDDIEEVIDDDVRLAEGGRERFDDADVANCSPALPDGVREWGIRGLRDVEGSLLRFGVSLRDVNNVSSAAADETREGADGENGKKETPEPAAKETRDGNGNDLAQHGNDEDDVVSESGRCSCAGDRDEEAVAFVAAKADELKSAMTENLSRGYEYAVGAAEATVFPMSDGNNELAGGHSNWNEEEGGESAPKEMIPKSSAAECENWNDMVQRDEGKETSCAYSSGLCASCTGDREEVAVAVADTLKSIVLENLSRGYESAVRATEATVFPLGPEGATGEEEEEEEGDVKKKPRVNDAEKEDVAETAEAEKAPGEEPEARAISNPKARKESSSIAALLSSGKSRSISSSTEENVDKNRALLDDIARTRLAHNTAAILARARSSRHTYYRVVVADDADVDVMVRLPSSRTEDHTFADLRRQMEEDGAGDELPSLTSFKFAVKDGGAGVTRRQEGSWRVMDFVEFDTGSGGDGSYVSPHRVYVKKDGK